MRGGLGHVVAESSTLDAEFMDAEDAPEIIDLLKVDVDEELNSVLEGATRLLQSGHVRALQLELDFGTDAEKGKVLDELELMGMQVYALDAEWTDGVDYPINFLDDRWRSRNECLPLQRRIGRKGRRVFNGGLDGSNYEYGDGAIQALQAMRVRPGQIDAVVVCYSQYVATNDSHLLAALQSGILI